MEDQLKVQSLDLVALRASLCRMTVWNCKNLENLIGIEAMNALHFLWMGKTKINPEEIFPKLPACLHQATVAGYGKKRDASITVLIQARGIAPASSWVERLAYPPYFPRVFIVDQAV